MDVFRPIMTAKKKKTSQKITDVFSSPSVGEHSVNQSFCMIMRIPQIMLQIQPTKGRNNWKTPMSTSAISPSRIPPIKVPTPNKKMFTIPRTNCTFLLPPFGTYEQCKSSQHTSKALKHSCTPVSHEDIPHPIPKYKNELPILWPTTVPLAMRQQQCSPSTTNSNPAYHESQFISQVFQTSTFHCTELHFKPSFSQLPHLILTSTTGHNASAH